MAQKTIQVSPLPDNVTKEEISLAFKNFSVARLQFKETQAFIEFGDSSDLEALDFQFENMKIASLGNAEIQVVDSEFKWDSSDYSSLNQDLSDKQQHSGESPIHLTKPDSKNLVVLKKCNAEFLNSRTSEEIKKEIFGSFKSINRILKKDDALILELQDSQEIQLLQSNIDNFKTDLGSSIRLKVNTSEKNVQNFAEDWIKQESSQGQIQEDMKEQLEDQLQKHCLHENIIPTLQKLTSMEASLINRKSQAPQKSQKSEKLPIIDDSEEIHSEKYDEENLRKQQEEKLKMQMEEEMTKKREQQRVRKVKEQEMRKSEEEKRMHEMKMEEERRIKLQEQEEAMRMKMEEQQKRMRQRQEKIRQQLIKENLQFEEKLKKQSEAKRQKEESEKKILSQLLLEKQQEMSKKIIEEEEEQKKMQKQSQQVPKENKSQQCLNAQKSLMMNYFWVSVCVIWGIYVAFFM